jgi:uncharacterized protein (DUF1778 family)
MPQNKPKAKGFKNTNVRPSSYRMIRLAAAIVDESITDFISDACDARALPILKRHKVSTQTSAPLVA